MSGAAFYGPGHVGLAFGVRNANHQSAIGHSGQDYNRHAEGTWIPAFAPGVVVAKVYDNDTDPKKPNYKDLGNYIVVQTWFGYVGYCHLVNLANTPEIGERVEWWQGVGPLGNTGYSFGAHLHLMVSLSSANMNGRRGLVDPLPYVQGAIASWLASGGYEPFPDEPDTSPEEDDDMIMRELIESPDGTVWYCYERILRFAIPEPRNLATYQAHLRALGHSDTIVKKSALDMAAYGSPVFDNPGKYIATAVDSVISDEAIEAKLSASTGDGAPALDVAALVAAINALPAKSAEATRVALAAALAG